MFEKTLQNMTVLQEISWQRKNPEEFPGKEKIMQTHKTSASALVWSFVPLNSNLSSTDTIVLWSEV
jgi:hypothetical protein